MFMLLYRYVTQVLGLTYAPFKYVLHAPTIIPIENSIGGKKNGVMDRVIYA